MDKLKLEYIKPFGPGILQGKLPKKIFDNFTKLSDEVIDKKRRNWNDSLVGVIDDEWKIPELLFRDFKIGEFLDKLFYTYVECFLDEHLMWEKKCGANQNDVASDYLLKVKRGDGWINYMKEMEYNPIHLHSHCSLTSIFYLNDYTGDKPISNKDVLGRNKFNSDGNTTFIYSSIPAGEPKPSPGQMDELGGRIQNFYSKSHIDVKPVTGEFFIFPSWLLHSVYPFKGKGNRITASVNYGASIRLSK
tara:strand:+ start:45 stop:785 length:741 start_codon:yes stop_codon:yes gene_type:complete